MIRIFFSFFFPLFLLHSFYLKSEESNVYIFPSPEFYAETSEDFSSFFENLNYSDAPEKKQNEDELIFAKSSTLEQNINQHVFGQEHTVKILSDSITRYAAGINDPNQPIASFLFCGPSGVGKTEIAKQLCKELYGNPSRLVRINMSEYSEALTISRLIGAPPGYIGYNEGGELTNALLKNPYSIVLLDEIEKAHPKILKIFLHVFDAGYLTSSDAKHINCRKCVFIMTSNLASLEIVDLKKEGYSPEAIEKLLKPFFMNSLTPELYNRLEAVILNPLTNAIAEKLVLKYLKELKARVYQSKRIHLEFDDNLVQYLVNVGIDPQLGARPLKRLIDKELTTLIAKEIIQKKYSLECVLKCCYSNHCIIIKRG